MTLVGVMVLVLAALAIGWLAVCVVGRAIVRRLPDPALAAARLGRRQIYATADRRLMLRARLRWLAIDARRSTAAVRAVRRELARLEGRAPVRPFVSRRPRQVS